VRDHGPEGAYIAAGFIRNRVWDSFYDPKPDFPENDVDVVYFNPEATDPDIDLTFQQILSEHLPGVNWQVKNQARMHRYGGHKPFKSLVHALSHWPETATAVAVRLDGCGTQQFLEVFVSNDLDAHILRITPKMAAHNPAVFEQRLKTKCWQKRWPDLTIIR